MSQFARPASIDVAALIVIAHGGHGAWSGGVRLGRAGAALRGLRAVGLALLILAIFVSACVAGYEAVDRLINPQDVDALGALAAAGAIGFAGDLAAARVRTSAGRRLDTPALVAGGDHARADAFALIGPAVTLVILRITWQSWRTVRAGPEHDHQPHGENHGHQH